MKIWLRLIILLPILAAISCVNSEIEDASVQPAYIPPRQNVESPTSAENVEWIGPQGYENKQTARR